MQTPNLDQMMKDAAGGVSIFSLEKQAPAALKEFAAWKADVDARLAALEAKAGNAA